MDLAVKTDDVDGTSVVVVGGEVDLYTAPLLRDTLDKQLQAGTTRIVVDLDAVDFIDSTGLGVLVGRHKVARHQAGWVRVVCSNAKVLRVFQITGLDKVFTITASVPEAVAAEGPG